MADLTPIDDDEVDPDDGEAAPPPTKPSVAALPPLIAPTNASEPDVSPQPSAEPDTSLTVPPAAHGHGDYSALSLNNWTNAYTDKTASPTTEVNAPHHKASGPHRAMLKVANFFGFGKGGAENDIGPENWQDYLRSHASNEADLNLNPDFGKKLAKTLHKLKSMGFNFEVISGLRSEKKQEALYKGYGIYDEHGNRIGETHKVARPGYSPHEDLGLEALAADLNPIGGNKEEAYAALHKVGKENGLEGVEGDRNHLQIANAKKIMAQLRSEQAGQSSQVATAHHPSSPRDTRLGA